MLKNKTQTQSVIKVGDMYISPVFFFFFFFAIYTIIFMTIRIFSSNFLWYSPTFAYAINAPLNDSPSFLAWSSRWLKWRWQSPDISTVLHAILWTSFQPFFTFWTIQTDSRPKLTRLQYNSCSVKSEHVSSNKHVKFLD